MAGRKLDKRDPMEFFGLCLLCILTHVVLHLLSLQLHWYFLHHSLLANLNSFPIQKPKQNEIQINALQS
jgi:hypothetical protein